MKVYSLKFFFNGDDVENLIKGVYTKKYQAIKEMVKQAVYENENNISEWDKPFEKVEDQLRYEGYIQHFGEIYFEIEEVELDKESEVNDYSEREQ